MPERSRFYNMYDGGAQFINWAAIWNTFLASCCCSCQLTYGDLLEGVTKWKNWGHEVDCNPRALNLTSHMNPQRSRQEIRSKMVVVCHDPNPGSVTGNVGAVSKGHLTYAKPQNRHIKEQFVQKYAAAHNIQKYYIIQILMKPKDNY
ncbi:hypothetical protein NC652_038259 [Populus alba x Populus x berolinensis]|nr:hypothetical protein NC652_038259 [Populus alba x Populus x berolinensis]